MLGNRGVSLREEQARWPFCTVPGEGRRVPFGDPSGNYRFSHLPHLQVSWSQKAEKNLLHFGGFLCWQQSLLGGIYFVLHFDCCPFTSLPPSPFALTPSVAAGLWVRPCPPPWKVSDDSRLPRSPHTASTAWPLPLPLFLFCWNGTSLSSCVIYFVISLIYFYRIQHVRKN